MFADDMPQAPFVPTFSGPERRTPLPEDLTENDLEALQIILPELDDHRLRARIADILWLRLKPRKVDRALAAIDAYREYPLQGRGFTWESRKAWKRAIYLAGLIRDPGKSRLAEMHDGIRTALLDQNLPPHFEAVFLAELFERVLANEDDIPRVAERLEEVNRPVYSGDLDP